MLRSAAQLASTDGFIEGYVASLNGEVGVLTQAYDPDTKTVQFPSPLPSQYTNTSDTPQLYLRVWEGQITGNQLGTAIELPGTGLSVTLTTESGAPPHLGDFWTIGVRPSTPSTVLPARLLREGQPPDGPRMWACPLAVIGWQGETIEVLSDCRNPFPSGGEGCCCSVSVTAAEASAKGLQEIIDAVAVNRSPDDRAHQVTICLCPGRYELPRPLELTGAHSYLRIEGCGDGVVIAAAADAVDSFGQGLIEMVHANNVTISGLEFELPQVPATAAKVAAQQRGPRHLHGADQGALPGPVPVDRAAADPLRCAGGQSMPVPLHQRHQHRRQPRGGIRRRDLRRQRMLGNARGANTVPAPHPACRRAGRRS